MSEHDELIERARALLDAATPGPWMAVAEHHGQMGETHPAIVAVDRPMQEGTGHIDPLADESNFIAEILPAPDGYDSLEGPDYYTADEWRTAWLNAEFIAAAPSLVRDLLAVVEGHRQENERLRRVVTWLFDFRHEFVLEAVDDDESLTDDQKADIKATLSTLDDPFLATGHRDTQPAGTYDRGAELGCPDCITREEHCCPFLWADAQPEPMRAWALRHMAAEFASTGLTAEVRTTATGPGCTAYEAVACPVHGHCSCSFPAGGRRRPNAGCALHGMDSFHAVAELAAGDTQPEAPDWDPDGEPDGPGSGDDRYGPHPLPVTALQVGDRVWVDPALVDQTEPVPIAAIEHGAARIQGWGWFDLNDLTREAAAGDTQPEAAAVDPSTSEETS